MTGARWLAVVGVLAVLLGLVAVLCLGVGSEPIGPWRALRVALDPSAGTPGEATIVRQVRLPRVALAAAVGAAFSLAGVAFQALLRNPLADPYVLGVSSGAALGAVGAIALGLGGAQAAFLGVDAVGLAAFLGSLGAIGFLAAVAGAWRGIQVHTLLLAGVMLNFFISALIMLLTSVVSLERLPAAHLWLMGSLARASGYRDPAVVGTAVVLAALALLAHARPLDVLALGEETAEQSGASPGRLKWVVFLSGSLLCGTAVASAGSLGFVGLIVPHAARMLLGPDHRLLVPAASLLGAAFVVGADAVTRALGAVTEVPAGVVTALCGGPFFVALLHTRGRRAWL